MTPDQYVQLKSLFGRLEGLDEAVRRQVLDELGVEPELERILTAMLHRADWEELKPLPGHKFDQLEVLHEIARGGAAVVFLGRDIRADRPVAIKVYRPDHMLEHAIRRHWERDLRSAQALDHPMIAAPFASGEYKGLRYTVMPYVDGPSLSELLGSKDEGSFLDRSPKRRAHLVAKIAQTLHYAHERGVVHRDVKPQNILVTDDEEPVVVDFGLSQYIHTENVTKTGVFEGTPDYMSPEQALARRVPVDHRSDVFSLGIVMYELIFGMHPFRRGDAKETMAALAWQDPPRPTTSSRESSWFYYVCAKALRKNPDRRYRSAELFAEDILRVCKGKRPRAPRPIAAIEGLRSIARRRPMVALWGLVAALAIGTTLAWSIQSHLALPMVYVEAVDEAGTPVSGVGVTVVSMDNISGPVGDPTVLGVTPTVAKRMRAGRYRFVLTTASGGLAELTRTVSEGDRTLRLNGIVREEALGQSKMKLIPGVTAEIYGGGPEGSPIGRRQAELPAYLIDSAEVTNAEYQLFLAETNRSAPRLWQGQAPVSWPDLPVVGVTYDDARAYAEWAGKRLPTAMEWQRAASGHRVRRFPDGDDWSRAESYANVGTSKEATEHSPGSPEFFQALFEEAVSRLVPADSGVEGAGPHGLLHTLGNAEEWTDSQWVEQDSRGRWVASPSSMVVVGAAWWTTFPAARLDVWAHAPRSHDAQNWIGFRCAKSVN